MPLTTYYLPLERIIARMSSALEPPAGAAAVSATGSATGAGAGSGAVATAGVGATVGAGAVSATGAATGVAVGVAVGADIVGAFCGACIPAGLYYAPHRSGSYCLPSTDASNISFITLSSCSPGLLGRKSPSVCKPCSLTAACSRSVNALSFLAQFEVV